MSGRTTRPQHDGRVTIAQADVLSIRLLGLHPVLVWGRAWLVDVD